MTKNKKTLLRIIVTLTLLIVASIVFAVTDCNTTIELIAFAVIYLIIGYDIIYNAIRGIIHGQLLDENFLMTVASLCAFLPLIAEYFDAVMVMLLYQVGELFQSYAVNKSRKSIASLMELAPDTAVVLRNENEIEVDISEIAIGETIVVKPGEKIPLDGEILKGCSNINTSPITGESAPRSVNAGDKVLSGCINIDSVLYITTTATSNESTVAKILELVENATSQKAPSEKFITKFSRFYTPIVVALAVIIAIVPPLFTGEWSEWIKRAMMFLFVSCPCALVISVPLSFFGGIAAASKNGILIKGSNYIELLAKTNIYACDKTGTLTEGKFSVADVFPNEHRQEVLQIASNLEQFSTHPIAKSICDELPPNDKNIEITEISGQGIIGKTKTDTFICGNKLLMTNNNIDTPTANGTVIYVAKNGINIGYIVIADKLKTDTKQAVTSLLNDNCDVTMLTGDNESTAKSIANEIGISYEANLLPQDKVNAVNKLKKQGSVAFIGDGINDAPVLVNADIGIAMGGIGSDSAIEAADIVLMHDNISSVPIARKIAHKTLRIVKENIVFALGIKFSVLVFSTLGIINSLVLAIFADVGVAFVAILNAMRTMIIKPNIAKEKQ